MASICDRSDVDNDEMVSMWLRKTIWWQLYLLKHDNILYTVAISKNKPLKIAKRLKEIHSCSMHMEFFFGVVTIYNIYKWVYIRVLKCQNWWDNPILARRLNPRTTNPWNTYTVLDVIGNAWKDFVFLDDCRNAHAPLFIQISWAWTFI